MNTKDISPGAKLPATSTTLHLLSRSQNSGGRWALKLPACHPKSIFISASASLSLCPCPGTDWDLDHSRQFCGHGCFLSHSMRNWHRCFHRLASVPDMVLHIFSYCLMSSFESHCVTVTFFSTFLNVLFIAWTLENIIEKLVIFLCSFHSSGFLLLFSRDLGYTREEMFWNWSLVDLPNFRY